jgi:fructose-specific PTS system IIA-like component
MAVDYCFKFPLPNGLHARPASHFEAVTRKFRSKVTLIHERTLYKANARSVLSMVSADIKWEDPCRVQISGEDEQPAMEAVRSFLKNVLPHCDESAGETSSIPSAVSPAGASTSGGAPVELPRSLRAAGLNSYLRGTPVSAGVGWGEAVIVGGVVLPPELERETPSNLAIEREAALMAITELSTAIMAKAEAARHPQEVQVLRAHASIVNDVALVELISELIVSKRRTAAQAIVEACRSFSDTLRNAQSAYLRERFLDIEDVCNQLLQRVVKRNGTLQLVPRLTQPSVCVADQLTPSQFLSLDRQLLRGLVLGEAGTTSHTVILARSMNVPTLVGVPKAPAAIRGGQEVIVDGELGLLITEVSPAARRFYRMEQEALARREQGLNSSRELPSVTLDGRAVEIGANVSSAGEVENAVRAGAQGIGLFRTEMLFMDRQDPPSEEEQTQVYSQASRAAAGRAVIIRLFDIGGDKPAPYLNLPAEDNPFLGYRGVRLYSEFATLVKAQLRAILRASSESENIKILVPMVSCLEEARTIRAMLSQAAEELKTEGRAPSRLPQLGVMIEVPSLAFLLPELCREVDFYSVGSNDLIQYFLAAGRTIPKVSELYTWAHPAFLRLLKSLVDQAHAHGKWIGLCGEMGENAQVLPLLLGLGFDEISAAVPCVSNLKTRLRNYRFDDSARLLDMVLTAGTREDVQRLLTESSTSADASPLFSPELVIQSDGSTKAEVIRQMTNALYAAGRVTQRAPLEEAIWKREDTYSTGFGHGVAIPHCKCDCLAANSVVIAKLASPVDWGSMDGKPVDVVILLAIRAKDHAEQHMRVFAKLSRLVMRDEFRERVRQEQDPAKLVALIEQDLG